MARKPNKQQINSQKMMRTTKNRNKLMGMSKKGKMIEFPKIIFFSKNGKNDGNFQKLNKCWKFPKIKYIGSISTTGVDSGS